MIKLSKSSKESEQPKTRQMVMGVTDKGERRYWTGSGWTADLKECKKYDDLDDARDDWATLTKNGRKLPDGFRRVLTPNYPEDAAGESVSLGQLDGVVVGGGGPVNVTNPQKDFEEAAEKLKKLIVIGKTKTPDGKEEKVEQVEDPTKSATESFYRFGEEKAAKYGDLVCSKLAGKTISKAIAKGDKPGGLVYEAGQLGIDMWDLLETLEGLRYSGKVEEVDDSTYLVKGCSPAKEACSKPKCRINTKKSRAAGEAVKNSVVRDFVVEYKFVMSRSPNEEGYTEAVARMRTFGKEVLGKYYKGDKEIKTFKDLWLKVSKDFPEEAKAEVGSEVEVEEKKPVLYVIKGKNGEQLSAPNPDDGVLWDRVQSMEARGRKGLKVVVYTEPSAKEGISYDKPLNQPEYEEVHALMTDAQMYIDENRFSPAIDRLHQVIKLLSKKTSATEAAACEKKSKKFKGSKKKSSLETAMDGYNHGKERPAYSEDAYEAAATELDATLPPEYLNNPSEVNFRNILKMKQEKIDRENAERELAERKAEAAKKAAPIIEKIKAAPDTEDINTEGDKISVAFNELVPDSGTAPTVAGEIVRSMMRILYRWWNDGDKFYEGYGLETCGTSIEYLVDNDVVELGYVEDMINEVSKFGDDEHQDDAYEKYIVRMANDVMTYLLKNPELFSEPNKADSRSGKVRWIDDYTPKYDYECEIPNCIMKHINAGNISERDLEGELEYWETSYGSIRNNSEEINVGSSYIEIIGCTKEVKDELEESFYGWLENYGDDLDNEHGDPDEEEDEDESDEEEEE